MEEVEVGKYRGFKVVSFCEMLIFDIMSNVVFSFLIRFLFKEIGILEFKLEVNKVSNGFY